MTLLIVHIAVLTLGLYNSVQTDPTDYYTHRAAFEYMCLYQLQKYFAKAYFTNFHRTVLMLKNNTFQFKCEICLFQNMKSLYILYKKHKFEMHKTLRTGIYGRYIQRHFRYSLQYENRERPYTRMNVDINGFLPF